MSATINPYKIKKLNMLDMPIKAIDKITPDP